MKRSDNGFFLTVEGGEGTGKSTLTKKLYEFLTEEEGRFVVKSFEPGGTPFGKMVRELLLYQEEVSIAPRSELFLYLADRAHHVETLIKPALREDMIVICDRFNDSSIAYQGAARQDHDMKMLASVCEFAADGMEPDLTLYLDLDPSIAFKRLEGKLDRLERESLQFHQRVREGYLQIAKANPNRVVVIDASQSPEVVYKQALDKLQERLASYGLQKAD